jgi:hypothetical protein
MIFLFLIITIYVGPSELHITCQDVRSQVSQYGIIQARNHFQKLARDKGITLTFEDYADAYKCIFSH